MAATITINKPPATPTLNSVTATTGSMAAGSYEFMFYTMQQSSRQAAPLVRSKLSNTKTLVLGANSGVIWDYTVPGDVDYGMLLYRKDGTHYQIAYFNVNFLSNPTTYTSTVSFATNYTIIENWTYYGDTFYGLRLDNGVGEIEITGFGDLHVSAIVAALKASPDAIEGQDFLDGSSNSVITTYGINAKSAGSGIFYLGAKLIITYGGFSNTGSAMTLSSSANGTSPAILLCPQRCGYFTSISLANCSLEYFVTGQGFDNLTITAGFSLSVSGGTIKNSLAVGQYITADSDVSDSIIFSSSLRTYGQIINGMTYGCSYVYPQCSNPSHFTNCIFNVGTGTYGIFYLPNDETGIPTFTDCKFYRSEVRLKYNEIGVWEHNLYDKVGGVEWFNTIALEILDNDSNPIVGAEVEIIDVFNNIYIATSGIDGKISEVVRVFRHENIIAEGPGTGQGVDFDFNPFTLTITKTGYQPETLNIDLQDKIDSIAVLVTPTYSDPLPDVVIDSEPTTIAIVEIETE